MRRALRRTVGSLTLRGRAFLASGTTALVCGLVLLERDLTRIGLLVAALPLLAGAFVLRRSHHLRVTRRTSSPRVGVGERVRVHVEVDNAGPSTGVLLLEEDLPDALGTRPRFVLGSLGRGERSRLEYAVTPTVRGRHALGPMTVRRREPFGMVEVRQELAGTESLLVLPPVLPLPSLRLAGGRFTSGDEAPRSATLGTVADVMVREYRRGDDLRRVHWRSTARTGELMVRNEEQLWQARALVALDTRRRSHRGRGADSSLEAAVVAAASVVSHLTGLGYQVRLLTADGLTEGHAERGHPPDAAPLLEALAVAGASESATMPVASYDEEAAPGVVVGILGEDRVEDRAWWRALTGRGSQGLALRLDPGEWREPGASYGPQGPPRTGPSTAPDRRDDWLLRLGWRVATLRRDVPLAAAWQGLDR